jgi:tRNA/tmRNA/rRNA uracil-C5-methylase (TrmA/RlmC/RlmD family)
VSRPTPTPVEATSSSRSSATPVTSSKDSGQETLLGPVEIDAIAHGGHCVARYEGRVIFVRHALPGERVQVQITDDSHDRYWRADAVQVLRPSADRVAPSCPIAGPGLCGGCDFQHVDLTAQRRLKAEVVAEQLRRLAGIDWTDVVEPADTPHSAEGLGWRTRMRYHVDDRGRAGLRAHRSHAVVPLPPTGCPIADRRTPPVIHRQWNPGSDLIAVAGATQTALTVDGELIGGDHQLVELAADRSWTVRPDTFWQAHSLAAETLVAAVLDGVVPRRGEGAFDLYCGVGLFAGALLDAGCRVWGVDANASAIELAKNNLIDAGDRVTLRTDRVERALRRLPRRADLIVLDPPRTGAGRAVMELIASRAPRAIAYVACDPAALARDLGTIGHTGYYSVTSIRAFDLFPMTAQVECVAIIERDPGAGKGRVRGR